jgi:CRISPR-associated protein Cmr1
MRKPPDIMPPETITHLQLDLIEQERQYKLITPLYGGGVTPGEVDLLTPIRGSEIRGHLRFWWRATRGGLFGGDLAKMKKKEGEIWGKAYQKEKEKEEDKSEKEENESSTFKQTVQIEVTVSSLGESKKPFNIKKRAKGNLVPSAADVPDYAVFPLRPPNDDLRRKEQKQIEDEMKSIQHHVQFLLTIAFSPAHADDVEAALWAWETFGGIGARTRRGFGALQLLEVDRKKNENLPPSHRSEDVRGWLNKNLAEFVVPGIWSKDVPHLEQALLFEVAYPEAKVFCSWKKLMDRYVSFRQFRTKGNTGRSHWPEAESIRNITRRRYYSKLQHPQKFPRAAFGLPIVFHFKDAQKGDPQDTTLQGVSKENERLASPLILRPLVCNDGLAIGLAVVLKGYRIPPLILKEVGEPVQAQLSKKDLAQLPDLNNLKLKGETDVLQAFLNDLGGNRRQ